MRRKAVLLFCLIFTTWITFGQNSFSLSIGNAAETGDEDLKSLTINRPDYAKRYRALTVNPVLQKKGNIALNDTLKMELFPGEEYLAIVEKAMEINGNLSYRAKITGYEYAWVFISSDNGKSLITIEIPEKNKSFRVEYNPANQKHFLFEVDKSKRDYIEESPALIPPRKNEEEEDKGSKSNSDLKLKSASSEKKTAADSPSFTGDEGPVVIDLMIVYTPAAAVWAAAREGGINNTIAAVMNMSQLALDNSNTHIVLNLVHSAEVDYVEMHSNDDLHNLTYNSDGYMDEVHTWRDAYGADVVVLLEETDFTGGLGWLLNNSSGSPGYAFSLTRVQQASRTYTVIHEIGHNMGAHHHKEQTTQPGPTSWWNWTENEWSAGWRWTGTDNGKYCSVMTYESGDYFSDGVKHTRVPYFSDPNISYQGMPTGDAVDADNARTLREMKTVVSNYREGSDDPGLFNAVAISQSQIDLSWFLNNGNPVLIAFSEDPVAGNPTNGVTYSEGETLPGGATVLYYGTATGYSHSGLPSSTPCFYKAWSNNSGTYSPGVTATATTLCDQLSLFPYSEQFNSGSTPECWQVVDYQGNGQVWHFNNPGGITLNSSTANNGFAILDSDSYGSGNSQNSDLVSPVFDFTGYTNISVQFEHYFQQYSASSGTFSYTTNGGDTWTDLQSWTNSTSNAEGYSVDLTSVLEGQSDVRFKWNYTGSWDYYWAVDDVLITAEQTSQVPVNFQVSSTLTSGDSDCFNATNNITVAGDGTEVIVESGGSANFIAGQSILFKAGFHAQEGSYVHARITTTGDYCVEAPAAIVAQQQENQEQKNEEKAVAVVPVAETAVEGPQTMLVYPNPNSGVFRVKFSHLTEETQVMLFNSTGQMIFYQTTADPEVLIDLPGITSGMYIVKAVNESRQFSQKIVVK